MATISPLDPIWANVEISEVAYLRVAKKIQADKGESAAFALILPDGSTRRKVVRARQEALSLIREKYINGETNYLEVLYNDQQLFGAELFYTQARLEELLAVASLYRALGDGWDAGSVPPY